MEIRRLVYFVCVAELGSLGRASEVLRIAQPALTRQVRLLEEELGVTLFSRTRRGMRLTEEGQQLLADVVGPLRSLEGALQNIRSFSSNISGNVVLGMLPTVATFLAQPLLERVARDEPDIALRIVEGAAQHLCDSLVSGEIDMGVLYGPSPDEKLRVRELVVEEMVLVGSPRSGLSPDRSISFEELTALPLILPNPRNGLRRISDKIAARYKKSLQIKYVIDSLQVQKEMVSGGHGHTILPVSAILDDVESGRLSYAPIDNPMTRSLILAAKSHNRVPRIMNRIEQIIEEVMRELHAGGRILGELKIGESARVRDSAPAEA